MSVDMGLVLCVCFGLTLIAVITLSPNPIAQGSGAAQKLDRYLLNELFENIFAYVKRMETIISACSYNIA